MWYRVFCRSTDAPEPRGLMARLVSTTRPVGGEFHPDDRGWASAAFRFGAGTPVYVERFRVADDDLRNDLNTWAAYLETLDYSPNHTRLMEHVIQTQQLFTIRKPLDHPNESAVDDLCRGLCFGLAEAGDGIFQIEDEAWYAADGTLLLQEY
jgi:hypothetical protein